MTAPDRRSFMAATAATIAAPVGLGAKECPAGMDWITMSLEARNLAYNNVEHVGPDNARKKIEGWAAASKMLREQRPQHLGIRLFSQRRRPGEVAEQHRHRLAELVPSFGVGERRAAAVAETGTRRVLPTAAIADDHRQRLGHRDRIRSLVGHESVVRCRLLAYLSEPS